MNLARHNFPSCCGAAILTTFWSKRVAGPGYWDKIEELEKELDAKLKISPPLTFVILNHLEYTEPGLEELLFSKGFKMVVEEVNYSPEPLRVYIRQVSVAKELAKKKATAA